VKRPTSQHLPRVQRGFILTVVLGLVGGGIGCGPSAAEVRKAKSAVYQCDEMTVFENIVEVVRSRTGRVDASQPSHEILSSYRWHASNGVPRQKGPAVAGPGDLAVGFAVRYARAGFGWNVDAKISILTHVVGSPKGQEIARDDADWPTWADDKLDTLVVAIHKRLQKKCPKVVYP
jgi:hypothetical protein